MEDEKIKDEKKIKEIISGYSAEKRFSLAIMQDIQREFNYIPREAMEAISEYLSIPLSRLYSMATFYKALSLKPKGKYVIKVCDGTACHIKGSVNLILEIKNILGIEPGETTADRLFSFETVNCVGACGLAPVVVIGEKYYGNVTPASLIEILKSYQGGLENAK